MFTEELNLIKTAEENAETLRKEAKQEAKRLVGEANTKAGELLSDAEQTAKGKYDALVGEGQAIADSQYGEAIDQAFAKCEKMAIDSGAKEDNVVEWIVERIVKSSVNC